MYNFTNIGRNDPIFNTLVFEKNIGKTGPVQILGIIGMFRKLTLNSGL